MDRTTVIVVETDVSASVPGYDSWWDVAVAEVSEMESVREARAKYEEARKRERRYLSPSGAPLTQKCESVTPHTVFLRNKCELPQPLDPLTEPVGEHWSRVEEITAPVFDTMIRQKGWHFMPVDHLCGLLNDIEFDGDARGKFVGGAVAIRVMAAMAARTESSHL